MPPTVSARRPLTSIDPGSPASQPTWWIPSFEPTSRSEAPRLSIWRWREACVQRLKPTPPGEIAKNGQDEHGDRDHERRGRRP